MAWEDVVKIAIDKGAKQVKTSTYYSLLQTDKLASLGVLTSISRTLWMLALAELSRGDSESTAAEITTAITRGWLEAAAELCASYAESESDAIGIIMGMYAILADVVLVWKELLRDSVALKNFLGETLKGRIPQKHLDAILNSFGGDVC